ncbi:PREDICTED: ubinuclein-1 isoform X2 [Wasmannia auropunctata]|uniref:ubinuclein-1 isoform X2 n=1 Tax=Wasmannia auropunctata TaxID=64793 RepID=UPI0005EDC59B|nr:PREDICTED: ubinuclein-1 isoform X2 [Wasmannia auropunctata]
MSEAKRVPLQTLEFPEPLGHATKKEKKGNMGKQLAPSFRFALTLPESNEKTCPEFNYAQLLKSAEKKQRKEQKRGDENTTNGLDPFDDDDDEDKLRDMARRFEAKYGTSTMGKKRHKYDDYVDLGAGYDENDSFIDNTDAYDEIVPEEMTTAHGGFYINCGALEFRAADRRSLVHNNNNNNNSDDEESSESSEEDTEDVDSPKRVDKRIISSSDDDETEDITGDNPRKRRKIEENSEKKVNHENGKKRKKPQNHQAQDAQQQNSQQDLDLLRRKEKNETTDAEGGTASEDQEEKKKSEKPEKNKISEKKFDIKKFEKKSSNSNGYDAKKVDPKRLEAKDSNIDDAIESVVNAAARAIDDDSSRDTTDSGKSRVCLYVESDGEEMENKEASLPENLPDDIREIVNKLKAQAETSKDGKSKFFNSAVNEVLFNLEKKLRMLNSPSIRLQTYGHLVRFLPCSKITLLSRAKKLYLKDAEHRVNEPMQKLKALIDNVMPSVMDKYMKECQKVADEKGLEGSPADAESSDEEDGSSKNAEKPKIPRKRFPWTDEAKKLVLEIANARRHYFKILRSRKESMESFVATFMDANVLPLWPPGYVRLQTLLKYASPVEPAIKKKLKKPKEMASANNVTASANTQVCNTVAKNDATNANNLLPQENERTNTTVSKVPIIGENSTNFASQATAKSNDVNIDRKQQHSNKYKDKHTENSAGSQQQECVAVNNFTVGKISVVPTAQLMAQKPAKSHVEKFNFMDLTNSSLSITRVDYDKLSTKLTEAIKDRVSITPCPEPVSHPKMNEITQAGHHSVYRQDASHSSAQALKHRFLQENADAKSDKRLDDKDVDATAAVVKAAVAEKKEKKRERGVEVKHKSSHDQKKRKKEHKMIEQQIGPINQDVVPMPQQTTLSKEEQEQRQNEETIAATNFLSQIINDDSSPRGLADKRKDGFITLDDSLANAVQPTEQEKDVQMVMRSLKELQELQEMKYSPNNSPVGGTIQKPGKSNTQYVTYQEDYQRLYLKKEDKIRSKEEAQW